MPEDEGMRGRQRFYREKEVVGELGRMWRDEEDEENKKKKEKKKEMVGNRWENEEAGKIPSG